MNLDPNNQLYIINGERCLLRELQYRNMCKLYSQDETLCLLGLIEEGLVQDKLYTRFDDVHPGRPWRVIKRKISYLVDHGWVK